MLFLIGALWESEIVSHMWLHTLECYYVILISHWKLRAMLTKFYWIPFPKKVTCGNNALEWHIMLRHTHSFILDLALSHRATHNAYIVTDPLAFWTGHLVCTLKGCFRNICPWWGTVKTRYSSLAFFLTTSSFSRAALCFWRWWVRQGRPEKHDQVHTPVLPLPFPLGGGRERGHESWGSRGLCPRPPVPSHSSSITDGKLNQTQPSE